MASQYYYLSGRCKWAKLFSLDERYNDWKINLYPNEASWKVWQESGMQGDIKQDDDGKYVTIRRKPKQDIGNKTVNFGPPEVFTMDEQGIKTPVTQLVGNGSEVTVKVQVYDTRFKGKGKRLEAVRVDKLIPYVKENEENMEGAHAPALPYEPKHKPEVGMPF